MITIGINDTNDIYLDNSGNISLKSDILAIQDIALNNVRTLYGEVPFNVSAGIPYFDVLFVAHPNIELFKQYVTEEIEKIDGVIEITEFETEIKDGVLHYELTILTKYGEATVNA